MMKYMGQQQMGKDPKEEPDPIVIYDPEDMILERCGLCWHNQGEMIDPCQCGTKYHQICLLRMVKQKMLSMQSKGEIDLSEIRCRKCKTHLRLLILQHTHYSCHYLCLQLGRSCSSRAIAVFLLLMLISVIGLAFVITHYSAQDGPIYYAMLFMETVLALMFCVSVTIFVQSSLAYKELVLVKVYQFAEYMKNTSSDGESPKYHIISDHFEIVIEDEA